ncbi:MAG: DUF3667 domain-containing protein [Parvularculaceae bacterium]
MASDTPELEPAEGGIAGAVGVGVAIAAGAACLSCGVAIAGAWCAGCGQKNDDMRRSSFVLAKDFVKDTFAFDSRMWRTLGLMVIAPGTVPASYSHGKRSRYTPPVRLFLVVSFLFFLVLSLTQTMFVAVEVRARTPEEIVEAKAAKEEVLRATRQAAAKTDGKLQIELADSSDALVIDGQSPDCEFSASLSFFVRPQDVEVDETLWTRCRDSIVSIIETDIESDARNDTELVKEAREVLTVMERVVAGVSKAVEDPASFNANVNTWLPRVMFLMTPVLALFMTIFLRGRDALVFDHLVFSFYAHATAFAIFGAAIVAAQFGAPLVFPVASAALFFYFVIALRRAYRRGWVKTVYSSLFVGLLYFVTLTLTVGGVISNQIFQGA